MFLGIAYSTKPVFEKNHLKTLLTPLSRLLRHEIVTFALVPLTTELAEKGCSCHILGTTRDENI